MALLQKPVVLASPLCSSSRRIPGGGDMSDFKWRHFAGEVILHGVRWYCKYGISYRDREEMMEERGIRVDHTTLYRWVQKYAPEVEKLPHWYRQGQEFAFDLQVGLVHPLPGIWARA